MALRQIRIPQARCDARRTCAELWHRSRRTDQHGRLVQPHAVVGEDPEFGRGISAFNRGSGDPDHKPNPSLAPIEKGPFYAIKVLPGSFGTFAGLKTDSNSRVLASDGEPISGLYAAGSDQANVMGGHYPRAASTSVLP